MTSCVFDIETDGLIEECTKVHCLVVYDIEEDRLFSFVGDEVEDVLGHGHDDGAARRLRPAGVRQFRGRNYRLFWSLEHPRP